jgi:hypothetical protein
MLLEPYVSIRFKFWERNIFVVNDLEGEPEGAD